MSDGHANNLDFFRFALACVVVFTHSFIIFSRTTLGEPLQVLTRGQITGGDFAVAAFFMISGFLITASWLRSRGLVDFLRRRILRIYPGFLVCCLVCILLVAPFGERDVASYYRQTNWLASFKNMLLLNGIELPDTGPAPFELTSGEVNGSLWTIKIEFECYLVVAVLGLLGLLRRTRVVLAAFLGVWLVYILIHYQVLPARLSHPALLVGHYYHFRFLIYFLLGALMYLARARIPYDARIAFGAVLVFALGAVTRTGVFLFPLSIGYVLFFAAFHPALGVRNFAAKRDLSYGIYLYGWPVQRVLTGLLGRDINPYLFTLLALPLTCGCAFLSWKLVEGPAQRLKRMSAQGRVVPAANG